METSDLPLSVELQQAEVSSLAEFAEWTRNLVGALLLNSSTLSRFTARPFLYIREPCRRVLWSRGATTKETEFSNASTKFFEIASSTFDECRSHESPSERLSAALASLSATPKKPWMLHGALTYVSGYSFPEIGTAFEKVLKEINNIRQSDNESDVAWTSREVTDTLRIIVPPANHHETFPIAQSDSYADFAEVLQRRRRYVFDEDEEVKAFAYLLAEHMIHRELSGAEQTDNMQTPLGALFVPLVFLGQYRAQVFWPFEGRTQSGNGSIETSSVDDVPHCLGRIQTKLNGGLGSGLLWVFSSVLRNQLIEGLARPRGTAACNKLCETFSYLCVSDAVLFADLSKSSDVLKVLCTDEFNERQLFSVDVDSHQPNETSLTYSVVNTPDIYVAIDLSLSDKWISFVGFNHVRFIISGDTLALSNDFFASVKGGIEKVHAAMLDTMWHVNFIADSREVIREIETIGRFIESESSRRDAERALLNYDGIGHALRTFVEATGYRGALQLARHVEKSEPNLGKQSKKRLRQVQQSLLAFEHAEGVGNLLRLHGWLNALESDQALITPKILRCFDEENLSDLPVSTLVRSYTNLLRILSQFIAKRFSVEIRLVDSKSIDRPERVLTKDDVVSPLQEVSIPGLHSSGDEGAVLLAMSVAVLEPLRNAAVHINRFADDMVGEKPSVVVLICPGKRGSCDVYVGNPLKRGSEGRKGESASYGLRLVRKIVEQSRIAAINEDKLPERTGEIEAATGYGANDWLWVHVELHPFDLHEYVKSKRPTEDI